MFFALGRWLTNYRVAVIAAWLLITVLLKLLAPSWSQVARDGDLEHLPATTTTARGKLLSSEAFPDDRAQSQIVLVFARSDQELSVEDRQFALDMGQQLERLPDMGVVDVWTEKTALVGRRLRSPSRQAVRVVVRLTNEFMATDNIRILKSLSDLVAAERYRAPAGLELGITGSAAIGGDMLSAAAASVASTHRTTILLVGIGLLVIYRSPLLVVVPLLTIGVAASVSIDLLALLADWSRVYPAAWPSIRIFTTTKIFVIVLLFGAGTDYCLFLTARFREQRAAGLGHREAVATALGRVGAALTTSALTTIAGLAMMAWADFGKFTYSGPAIAVSLGVTLVACLTLMPALLTTRLGAAAVGNTANAATGSGEAHPVWNWLAVRVLSRPGWILVGSLLAVSPLAWIGARTDVTYDLLGELDLQRESRRGTQLLERHFPPGEIGPLVVLAKHHNGDLASVDGQMRIAKLAKPLDDLPGIAEVRSLYRPTGDPPGTVRFFSSEGLQSLAVKGSPLTQAVFVSQQGDLAGKVTRLFLIVNNEPFSAQAVQTCEQVELVLDRLRTDPNSDWHNATFELLGPTAGIRDLEQVTVADRRRIQILVAAAVLVVLVILLRQPAVCCYLIATVILSYLVTLGITDLVFHALRGDTYVGLDWKVPLFLYVILVAVGQDYNIYLVTRVREEQLRLGPLEGLRHALVQSGAIITSCGIIMACTFVSMTTAELNGMVELGFALSLGILIDTFFVRTVLVPAMLGWLIRVSSAD
ncbi:MAG: MMPL family transporter [Pirellulales bacterium]|nr:MMPL family transporter [Pirellulales bacterium]